MHLIKGNKQINLVQPLKKFCVCISIGTKENPPSEHQGEHRSVEQKQNIPARGEPK